jgi:acetyl-CoA C-acetyltransferase
MTEAYIYDAVRTPRGRGKVDGALFQVKPVDLLSAALRALAERTNLAPSEVDDVLIGCVTPIDEQGYNIAKAALLHAGWREGAGAMQLNRYCASGLEAVNLAAMKIRSGWEEFVIAGGVESMSRVPIGSDGGPLLYDPEVIGRTGYIPQGLSADLLATLEGYEREALDAYALRSHRRAATAREEGYFSRSLAPIHDANGLLLLDKDELIRLDTGPEALAALPPAFAALGAQGFDAMALRRYPHLERVEHRHTAGNSSGIADGAALVLLGSEKKGRELGLRPRARLAAAAIVGVEPTLMLHGPAPAARQALRRAGMRAKDVDLWECNESYAAAALHFQREMEIADEALNVNGGAIALGHPLGATGAMLLSALIDELERRDLGVGLVALSAGGGMGVAAIIERV